MEQKELQRESNRMGDIRREIEMEKKELGMGMGILKDKEVKAEMGKIHEPEASRLRERRRTVGKDIATKNAETFSSTDPPPTAHKTKAPPTNLLGSPKKSPIKAAQLAQDDEISCIPGEEEGRENIQ